MSISGAAVGVQVANDCFLFWSVPHLKASDLGAPGTETQY